MYFHVDKFFIAKWSTQRWTKKFCASPQK
jgi:hypothetical protein